MWGMERETHTTPTHVGKYEGHFTLQKVGFIWNGGRGGGVRWALYNF